MFYKKVTLGITLLSINLLLLAGCTYSSGKSSLSHLSDQVPEASSNRVKNDLTRSALILFQARVKAYPMTGALVKATLQEEGKKRGLSEAQINQLYYQVTEFQKDRSCFHVEIASGRSFDAVNLGYWGVQWLQRGKVFEGQFIDIYKPGFSSTTTRYYTTTYKPTNTTYLNSATSTEYFNSGTVCTAQGSKIDYLDGFQMKMRARFMRNPKIALLTWEQPR